MSVLSQIRWFSTPRDTIEEARQLYEYGLFNPAAVFKAPGDGYVLGYIKEMDVPPHETAKNLKHLTGMEMVAYVDPLVSVWKEYEGNDEHL